MRKFIILGRSRTGSNMIKTALKKHSNIVCYGEVFKDYKKRNTTPKKEIDRVWGKEKNDVVGCKIFYYHPNDTVEDYLSNDFDIRVIHLKRKNVLRALVSGKIAEKNNWYRHNGRKPNLKDRQVNLDPEYAYKTINKTKYLEKKYDEVFKYHPIMEITYEQISDDFNLYIKIVQKFLGVEPKTLKQDTKKQNPESLHKLIKNDDEMYKFLNKKDKNYTWMINC